MKSAHKSTGFGTLPAAVLLLALAPARAQEDEWLPNGLLFPPLIAGQNEALNYASLVRVDSEDDTVTGGFVSLGAEFPLYRQIPAEEKAWQVGLFAAVQSQFNLDAESYALINSDYLVGVPLSWRKGAAAWRVRLFHQSSHLGDELILSQAAPPRRNISFEAIDVLFAHGDRQGWRPYGGFTAILSSKEDIGHGAIHLGTEWRGADRRWRGRPVAALDLTGSDARDWRPQMRAMIGVEFGSLAPGEANVGAYLEVFTGPAPFGQFYSSDITFAGVTLHFDLN